MSAAASRREYYREWRHRRELGLPPPPKDPDGIPQTMCLHCGMRGEHETPADCIGALRDRIADLSGK